MESRCQNLSLIAKSVSQDEYLVLCPPTNTCYYCNALGAVPPVQRKVVFNVWCSKGGKDHAAMQAMFLYNYARYGSMNENGSRFYETARDATEVSDTLLLPSSPGTSVQPCVHVL